VVGPPFAKEAKDGPPGSYGSVKGALHPSVPMFSMFFARVSLLLRSNPKGPATGTGNAFELLSPGHSGIQAGHAICAVGVLGDGADLHLPHDLRAVGLGDFLNH
jgi:hypothetical protein